MSNDPSFLPKDMRPEDDEQGRRLPREQSAEDGFHIPESIKTPAPPDISERVVDPSPPPPVISSSPPTSSIAPSVPLSTPTIAAVPPKTNVSPRRNGSRDRNGKAATIKHGSGIAAAGLHIPKPDPRIKLPAGITLLSEEFKKGAVPTGWWWSIAAAGILIAALIIGATWFVLRLQINRGVEARNALQAHWETVSNELATARGEFQAYEATSRRALAVRTLLRDHRFWNVFFQLLESRTLPGVSYQDLSADVGGSVTLSAIAPDVRTMAEQIIAWQTTTGLSNIDVSGITTMTDDLGVINGVRSNARFMVGPSYFSARAAVDAVSAPQ